MLRSSKLVLNVCRKNSKRNEISPLHRQSSPVAFCEINDGIKNVEINEIRRVITSSPCNLGSDFGSDHSDWIPACLEDTMKYDFDDDDSSETIIATDSQFTENDNFYFLPFSHFQTKSSKSETGSNF